MSFTQFAQPSTPVTFIGSWTHRFFVNPPPAFGLTGAATTALEFTEQIEAAVAKMAKKTKSRLSVHRVLQEPFHWMNTARAEHGNVLFGLQYDDDPFFSVIFISPKANLDDLGTKGRPRTDYSWIIIPAVTIGTVNSSRKIQVSGVGRSKDAYNRYSTLRKNANDAVKAAMDMPRLGVPQFLTALSGVYRAGTNSARKYESNMLNNILSDMQTLLRQSPNYEITYGLLKFISAHFNGDTGVSIPDAVVEWVQRYEEKMRALVHKDAELTHAVTFAKLHGVDGIFAINLSGGGLYISHGQPEDVPESLRMRAQTLLLQEENAESGYYHPLDIAYKLFPSFGVIYKMQLTELTEQSISMLATKEEFEAVFGC